MSGRRRILFSAGIIAVVVGVAIGVLSMLPRRPGVTRANFDRIEDGMTLDEVSAILGKNGMEVSEPPALDGREAIWRVPDGTIVAIAFLDNRVTQRMWVDSTETITDKIRRWLGLPKVEAAPVPFVIPPPPKFP